MLVHVDSSYDDLEIIAHRCFNSGNDLYTYCVYVVTKWSRSKAIIKRSLDSTWILESDAKARAVELKDELIGGLWQVKTNDKTA
jgi:hypothetical protein